MKRLYRRLLGRLSPVLLSDTAFVERAYREVLGREADQDGLDFYRSRLGEGESRTSVLLGLATSEEFARRFARPAPRLPNLRDRRSDRYRREVDLTTGQPVWVFGSTGPSDLDWLESQILENGYYEEPGVWNLGIDVDKRVMAEIVGSFAPERALELGCAAGAVLECLRLEGVRAEGVEISASAADQAPAEVRSLIHRGDLLALDLPADYDVVFGLDVFEHLNPNRLDAYLERLVGLTREGGYVFCNVPAFGDDPVFGTVFPLYLEAWRHEGAAARAFSALHVDDLGYPLHGHLIWAESAWWVGRFEAQGLRRETGLERALHAKYDRYMDKRSRARKAFYVFSKAADPARTKEILERIGAEPSKALNGSVVGA
jgi:SAM-dependent methyltransferase